MRISTKGRYALRLLVDLAKHQEEGNIALKDISTRQQISIKYLEQIVSKLTKAGVITSTRGPQGGYALANAPEALTVKQVIEVMEGPIACVACLADERNRCPRYEQCNTISLFEGLNDVIIKYLESYTIKDLMNQKK